MIMILNNPNCNIIQNGGGGGGHDSPPTTGSKPTEQSCSYNITIYT